MSFIPANLEFTDDANKTIVGTIITSNGFVFPGQGYWITDNAYANDMRNYWGGWWLAYFYNNNTVKIGFYNFASLPTEQEILNIVFNITNWTGNLQYTTPISNICFPAGTPIACNQGNIPIEKINPEIHTIRNKPIVGITKTVHTSDKYLVCFEKDSLGNNIPSQKTIMSKTHKIFYKSQMLNAHELVGLNDKIKKIKYSGEILYNVLMEDYDKMMVNNLICETLDPQNDVAKLYKACQKLNIKEQQQLIKWYNEEYKKKNNIVRK